MAKDVSTNNEQEFMLASCK
ncbi:uncharacterized protein G2W53_036239 [Senna tora]|uniref:Uncharacterized protein n=1 Tax=Senna tora TaxID=362788 RepID=A0A834W8J4_9FABA|nr:uncharacterized protein G2W53_036239 [Senna tora]